VSILAAVHNNPPRYIKEFWESCKAQTLREWELVLVDDGAPREDVQALIAEIEKDPRVRVVRMATNSGLPAALNTGAWYCRAPLIARMDDDDVMMPDRLEKQVAWMRKHPGVDFLGGQLQVMDGEGNLGRITCMNEYVTPQDAQDSNWLMNHPTVVMRKQALFDLGGYDTRCRVSQDLDLWLRAIASGKVLCNLPDILIHHRKHEGQQTGRGDMVETVRLIRERNGYHNHIAQDYHEK